MQYSEDYVLFLMWFIPTLAALVVTMFQQRYTVLYAWLFLAIFTFTISG